MPARADIQEIRFCQVRSQEGCAKLSVHRLLTRSDGITMLVVLLVLMTVSVISLFGAYKTQTEIRIAHNGLLSKKALAAAEAGVSHAFALIQNDLTDGLNDELSSGGTGGGLTALGSTTTLHGTTYRFHAFGGGASDGYAVRVIDNFDETSGTNDPASDTDSKIKIIAIGQVGGAERMLEVMVEGKSVFAEGIFGRQLATVNGGSVVDSYDCTLGPYGGANIGTEGKVRSNGDITLAGATTVIHGNATAGGSVKIGTGTLTGTSTNNATPLTFPPVAPCGLSYSSGSGITLPAGDTYNPATGELRGNSGATITIANGTYCFSRITLNAGSSLQVNGPVNIYLTDRSDMSGGTVVNTSHMASNLRLYSSGVGNSQKVSVSGGSDAYMGIYAPTAGVALSGNSDFFGAIVADSIETIGGTDIHYDKCLANLPSGMLQMTSWNDVRN